MVHEGPAPKFFSRQLLEAIAGEPAEVVVPVDELPDSSMKDDLKTVRVCLFTYVRLIILSSSLSCLLYKNL